MSLQALVRDNPVLVKHVRSRLRRKEVLPSVAATMVVCLLIVWLALAQRNLGSSWAVGMILVIQGIILFCNGAGQVATAVAHAKDTHILDFHRISPLHPSVLTVGFVLGGPIREWVLFACTLPFAFICVSASAAGPGGFLLLMIQFAICALIYHSMGVISGLISAKARNAGGSIVALVVLIHSMAGAISIFVPAIPTVLPTYRQVMGMEMGAPHPTFYGAPIPEFLLSLIHQLPLLAFFYIAIVRRMRHELSPLYSKPAAVGVCGVIAFLLVGDVVGIPDLTRGSAPFGGIPPLIVIYGTALTGILLSLAVTPNAGAFSTGVRRARKLAQSHVPVWSDAAANWAPLLGFSGVLLAASLLATLATKLGGWGGAVIAASFVGAGVVYYFGSARQAFELMYGKNSGAYFGLLIFMVWLVPLLMAGLASVSSLGETLSSAIGSLSPIMGIALIAAAPTTGGNMAGAGMCFSSTILLCILFTQLRLQAERRAREGAMRLR